MIALETVICAERTKQTLFFIPDMLGIVFVSEPASQAPGSEGIGLPPANTVRACTLGLLAYSASLDRCRVPSSKMRNDIIERRCTTDMKVGGGVMRDECLIVALT